MLKKELRRSEQQRHVSGIGDLTSLSAFRLGDTPIQSPLPFFKPKIPFRSEMATRTQLTSMR